LKSTKNDILKKMLMVILFIYLVVILTSLFFTSDKTFYICYSLGTIGAILSTFSLYKDIIGMYNSGRWRRKGFYIRYLFSASLFLIAGFLFQNKTLAIISVFFGLINIKLAAYIAGFIFGGGRREKKD